MASITLRLPSMLAAALGGRREVPLQAATIEAAFLALKRDHPDVARHLFDESGKAFARPPQAATAMKIGANQEAPVIFSERAAARVTH